jgi:hypothetical protein
VHKIPTDTKTETASSRDGPFIVKIETASSRDGPFIVKIERRDSKMSSGK